MTDRQEYTEQELIAKAEEFVAEVVAKALSDWQEHLSEKEKETLNKWALPIYFEPHPDTWDEENDD